MIAANPSRVRVAQVVHGLVAGGIETWLVNVLRRIDRRRFQIDFITSAKQPCFYDDTVRSLGARILHCPTPKRPWVYGPTLYRLLRQGEYDAIHAHSDHYSGFVLQVARMAGVPIRIAHSHSNTQVRQSQAKLLRRFYLRAAKSCLKRHATTGLAVSDLAGQSLFPSWSRDPRWRLLYCGIDTSGMAELIDRTAILDRYGIPESAFVMAHVGGFRPPKNYPFLLDIAAAVMARRPDARLLLIGDGPLRAEVEQLAQAKGIADRVVFTGLVECTFRLLRAASDVFVFPSLWEGLPLAVVEAQSLGVPCVISDVITAEVSVAPALVTRASLNWPAEHWADEVLEAHGRFDRPSPKESLAIVEASRFNLRHCVAALEKLYAGE